MEPTTFYRPARAYPPVLPHDDIVVSVPPVVQLMQTGVLNWLKYMLPAVGGLGSLFFIVAFHSSLLLVIIGILISFAAVGSGVMMGVIQQSLYRRQRRQQAASYLEYLSFHRKYLQMLSAKQRLQDARLYPSYEKLADLVEQREYLWERRPTDLDFLSVRIGTGPAPLCRPLRLDLDPNDFLTQFVPDLRAQAEGLISEFNYLDDLSATISLRGLGLLSIAGDPERTRALARALLCQITAFHAPEDIRCLIYFSPEHTPVWEWAKWLPHARCLRHVKSDRQSINEPLCMMADSVTDLQEHLRQQIMPELERRRRLSEEQGEFSRTTLAADESLPHIVIILDDFSPRSDLGQLSELNVLCSEGAAYSITVICLVADRSREPAQVQARLLLSNAGLLEFVEIKLGGRHLNGLQPDRVAPDLCERIARSMSPLSLAGDGVSHDLSQDVRLLDLLRIPSADRVEPDLLWGPRARSDFLRVPIGLRADGRPLYLDLKEAAEGGLGPHGLIVGATGSGKSELLRTLVIALAITHDPQLLNFVLVDFKGGASFADFEALPHVAGIVTNLQSDLSLVDRVYASLLGEQQRRQRLLHEAGNLDNIKQYHTLWRQNPTMEPMPHLLVVADEFAELIAIRPDFLDLFVTLGRVGRSLGLHLLFATQRLEEGRIKGLESHLRYRICLRTFSAIESRTVLGQPDAYHLPSVPGMGYFKADTDTYDLFKTALVSAPFVPVQTQSSPASKVRIFSSTGRLSPYFPAQTANKVTAPLNIGGPDELHTEMDVIVERLAQTKPATRGGSVHQVWLPPLANDLSLGNVLRACRRRDLDGSNWEAAPAFGELRVPVGLVDMPLEQAQDPLWLDFSGIGGHLALVGAPQSGKSTFLRTLLTSFMLTHSPRDVQFYCIDMGGGQLRIFEQAPHIGAVCSKPERDKVRRVVRQMHKIIEEREILFRERGIDSMATFRMLRQRGALADIPFGDVFLVIDNFAQFFQSFDVLEPELMEIVSGGLTYGVHLIVATGRWAEIRSKLRDNIGTRLELRLNDPLESELGKVLASAIPVGMPGRGANSDKLHFQVALPVLDAGRVAPGERNQFVQEALSALIQHVCTNWKEDPAPQVHLIPTMIPYEELPVSEAQAGVPLGVEEFRLDPVYIDLIANGPHFIVVGDTECGKTSLLRAWLRGIEQRYLPSEAAFAVVDYRKRLVDFTDSKHLLIYAHNSMTMAACVGNLKVDLDRRMQKTSEVSPTELRKPQPWSGRHYFLFVDDYEALMTSGGNPLAPLAEYLLSGHDIGFHLVTVHRTRSIGRVAFEPVFQSLIEMGTSAFLMSGDPAEGKILYGQSAVPLPPGRGYLVQPRRSPLLIQTAFVQPQYAGER